MKSEYLTAYNLLIQNLQELILGYRDLYEIVLEEFEILIGADREKLEQNNIKKEKIILHLQHLDQDRQKIAYHFSPVQSKELLRLLQIADLLGGQEANLLREAHSTLDTLIRRIAEKNKSNAEYAESALKTLNGALGNVKETLSGKKTYERKGGYKQGPDVSGNFISKNV